MDDLISNTGAVNLIAYFVFTTGAGKTWANIAGVTEIADIANCNFTGFASWHRLHHDGSIAKYQLEARSNTADGGGPHRSASIVNFADFAGHAAKVGNS